MAWGQGGWVKMKGVEVKVGDEVKVRGRWGQGSGDEVNMRGRWG